MSIELGDIEDRLREAASRSGQDVEGFVRSTLINELECIEAANNRRNREEALRREFADAMRDPLFVQDVQESMLDFTSLDAEMVGMTPDA